MEHTDAYRSPDVIDGDCAIGRGPSTIQTGVIIFEHPRAPGKVSEDKLHQSMRLAAQELHVSGELQSSVYVFHISAGDAKAAGVEMTSVWKTSREGGYRYELWILGEPTDEKYGALAISVLKDTLNLSLEQNEAKRLKDIVAMKLGMILSAREPKPYK